MGGWQGGITGQRCFDMSDTLREHAANTNLPSSARQEQALKLEQKQQK